MPSKPATISEVAPLPIAGIVSVDSLPKIEVAPTRWKLESVRIVVSGGPADPAAQWAASVQQEIANRSKGGWDFAGSVYNGTGDSILVFRQPV